jgi:calcineurin-like phosphoesterase family protein
MSGMSVQLIHNYEHANLENNLILCGHSHGKFQTKEVVNKHGVPVLIINTCVENKNYYPFSWDEIMSIWSVWLKNHPKRKIILSNLQKEK